MALARGASPPLENIAALHAELLDQLNAGSSARWTLAQSKPITRGGSAYDVADDPTKSYVADRRSGQQGVLILSNAVNPALVARSVARAAEARAQLGELGRVVLQPVASGDFGGQSYAIWPLQRALSSWRLRRAMQKRLLRRRVLVWLRGVAGHTRRPAADAAHPQQSVAAPLEAVASDGRLAQPLRSAAEQALERLADGRWQPVTVLEHTDLWLGNFLLPWNRASGRTGHGFYVIDWAGAATAGRPFFDLLKFASSSNLPRGQLRRELDAHCQLVQCQPQDAQGYLLASLGALGMNLEHFPAQRYLALCESLFAELEQCQDS